MRVICKMAAILYRPQWAFHQCSSIFHQTVKHRNSISNYGFISFINHFQHIYFQTSCSIDDAMLWRIYQQTLCHIDDHVENIDIKVLPLPPMKVPSEDDFTDDKSILVQVMDWCRQIKALPGPTLTQTTTPHGVNKPHWVNAPYSIEFVKHHIATIKAGFLVF